MRFVFNLCLLFFLNSCLEMNCEEFTEIRKEEECLSIVEIPPNASPIFEIKGKHPYTNEPCKCKSTNRWWDQYSEQIEIGDTIFKRKGELTFNIHKKDTVISHQWECIDTENRFLKHWGF